GFEEGLSCSGIGFFTKLHYFLYFPSFINAGRFLFKLNISVTRFRSAGLDADSNQIVAGPGFGIGRFKDRKKGGGKIGRASGRERGWKREWARSVNETIRRSLD